MQTTKGVDMTWHLAAFLHPFVHWTGLHYSPDHDPLSFERQNVSFRLVRGSNSYNHQLSLCKYCFILCHSTRSACPTCSTGAAGKNRPSTLSGEHAHTITSIHSQAHSQSTGVVEGAHQAKRFATSNQTIPDSCSKACFAWRIP